MKQRQTCYCNHNLSTGTHARQWTHHTFHNVINYSLILPPSAWLSPVPHSLQPIMMHTSLNCYWLISSSQTKTKHTLKKVLYTSACVHMYITIHAVYFSLTFEMESQEIVIAIFFPMDPGKSSWCSFVLNKYTNKLVDFRFVGLTI